METKKPESLSAGKPKLAAIEDSEKKIAQKEREGKGAGGYSSGTRKGKAALDSNHRGERFWKETL